MNGKFQRIVVLITDSVLIFMSLFIAYILRHNSKAFSLLIHDFGDFQKFKFLINLQMPFFKEYMTVFSYGTIITLFCFFYFRLYSFTRNAGKLDEVANVLKAITFSYIFILSVTFFYRTVSVSRLVIIHSYFIMIFLLSSFRVIRRFVVQWLRKRGFGVRNVLIYGGGEGGKIVKHHLEFHSEMGYKLIGFLDDNPKLKNEKVDGIPVIGNISSLSKVVSLYNVHDVIIAIPSATRNKILRAVLKCENAGVEYYILPNIYEFMTSTISINRMGTVPLMKINIKGEKNFQYFLKRSFDYIFSFLSLLFLAPVFLIIYLLIKLDSKGPAFFSQIRVGKDGQLFNFYKFRTMVVEAEKLKSKLNQKNEVDGPIFKMKNDPRITRIGKFLRKFSLDELPQIFNVFKGDMSFVGPRPPIPDEVKKYEGWQKTRLSVIPGITGLWQVSGRSTLSFEQMVRLDLYYIENWSLWLDLKIILSTVPTVIFCKGAF